MSFKLLFYFVSSIFLLFLLVSCSSIHATSLYYFDEENDRLSDEIYKTYIEPNGAVEPNKSIPIHKSFHGLPRTSPSFNHYPLLAPQFTHLPHSHLHQRHQHKIANPTPLALPFAHTQRHDDFATFFISVAAFRDPECVELVREAFSAALNPRRVFLGLIEQIEPGDPVCIPPEYHDACAHNADFCPIDNLRRRRVVSRRGKGPTYGRYVSFLMYRGESYYMMIDSHTGFIRHWDRRIFNSFKNARSPRPVLSHYPHKWIKKEPSFRESQSHAAVMCNGHYVPWGFIRLDGRMFARALEPWPEPFAAAGFLFGDAALVHHVPFDPLLDYVFDGEEVLYSTRMWTHGYDIFAPEMSFVFHSYGRRNASKYWGTQTKLGNKSSYGRAIYWSRKRVQYMLFVTYENTTRFVVPRNITVGRVRWQVQKYGLGRERSILQYNRYAMLDQFHRKSPPYFCAKILKDRSKL